MINSILIFLAGAYCGIGGIVLYFNFQKHDPILEHINNIVVAILWLPIAIGESILNKSN